MRAGVRMFDAPETAKERTPTAAVRRLHRGQRRVIRFDLPGFGLTGPAPDNDYHLPRYATFVVAMMDHLGVKQAMIAGNSLGGEVAWKTSVDYPGRVSKLVLVDAGGRVVARFRGARQWDSAESIRMIEQAFTNAGQPAVASQASR